MDATVPPGAALLLDFIAFYEAPKGYGTVYGNNQGKLPDPLVTMTLDEVIAAGKGWTKAFGSSACGRYQFMRATLQGLKSECKLTGRETFSADLQDRLGYHLLKRRGYAEFAAGTLGVTGFGLRIAQEWASFPVLAPTKGAHRSVARGQSYYVGDGLNKALVKPEAVEAALARARAAMAAPAPMPPVSTPAAPPPAQVVEVGAIVAVTPPASAPAQTAEKPVPAVAPVPWWRAFLTWLAA